jgi:hypothetical protein
VSAPQALESRDEGAVTRWKPLKALWSTLLASTRYEDLCIYLVGDNRIWFFLPATAASVVSICLERFKPLAWILHSSYSALLSVTQCDCGVWGAGIPEGAQFTWCCPRGLPNGCVMDRHVAQSGQHCRMRQIGASDLFLFACLGTYLSVAARHSEKLCQDAAEPRSWC